MQAEKLRNRRFQRSLIIFVFAGSDRSAETIFEKEYLLNECKTIIICCHYTGQVIACIACSISGSEPERSLFLVRSQPLPKEKLRGDRKIKRRGRKQPVRVEDRTLINEAIRYPQIRLIDSDGGQLGVLPSADALRRASDQGLDLVEVAAKAKPPVCRIMDYDKFRYEQAKKLKEAKKKQTVIETKEIKFRPKTEAHDLNFKIKKIKKFLAAGNKVKLTMRFRGREIVYAQTVGLQAINRIADALRDDAVILQEPRMEGRQLVAFVGPKSS